MKAFVVMGRVLKAAYEDLFLCVFMSIAFWIGVLPVVTIPLVIMGIQTVTNRIANYKRVDNGFFWEGTRTHIAKGWLLFLISLVAPVLIVFNIYFYINSGSWLPLIGFAWLWLLLLSQMIGQYVFPLFIQQDEPNVLLALRNAVVLTLRHPLYSFLMLLFQLLLLALSIGLTLPLVLLAPALLGLANNFALIGLLQEMDLAPEPPEISGR